MILCECDEHGVCVRCGEPRRNCNAKRHCRSSGKPLDTVLKKRYPVGTGVAAVLGPLKIKITASCTCSTTRKILDYNGVAWSLRNIGHVSREISGNAKRLGKWCPRWLAVCVVVAGVVVSLALGKRDVVTFGSP